MSLKASNVELDETLFQLQAELHPIHETVSQVLLVTVKQFRHKSPFRHLNWKSQNAILSHLWAPFFILKLSSCSSSSNYEIQTFRRIFEHLRALNLDIEDLEHLEIILMCRSDYLDDSQQVYVVKCIRQRSLDSLARKYSCNYWKLAEILLVIPVLLKFNSSIIHSTLFKPIIGDIPMERIIATI